MAEVTARAGAIDTGDGLKVRQLTAAPHRLMFMIGASNLMLAMLWWTAWLFAQRWPVIELPQPGLPAGWLHAYVMQYQMLPSFIFGFLLTVFPRWLGLAELQRWQYVPVGLGLFGGQVATLLGAFGWEAGLTVGLIMTIAGWIAGLVALTPLLRKAAQVNWHARSCLAALVIGLLGLLCHAAFVLGYSPMWIFASIKLGTFGLLLPIYLTVAHRMFPFFAASAMTGYVAWRPLWILAAFWLLCLGHVVLELTHAYQWLWATDLPMLGLTASVVWRWWPRGPKPALLTVLFAGLSWLPIAFALYSTQSVVYLFTGTFALGRAPAHALFIGFFGSVLIAMVTRVTQGHSGRALVMPSVAWFAFIAVQLVALTRIAAELLPDQPLWQFIAAMGWLVALAPWVARLGKIYLSARLDGKAG